MKYVIFILALAFNLIISLSSYAQSNLEETYYDYNWKEIPDLDNARFYSVSKKTGSGWLREDYYLLEKKPKIQMEGLFTDKEHQIKNGLFRWFYAYSGLKTIGKYVDNKREGIWFDFFENGQMEDSLNYKNGQSIGTSLKWYKNGFEKDSLIMDDSGNGTYVAWFDNGSPSEAGRYINFDKKNGRWQYFNKEGHLAQEQVYNNGILQLEKNYNENGTISSDTTSKDREAYFPGGDKAWNKFLVNTLSFPGNLALTGSGTVTVVVSATVDEDGKLVDLDVPVPFQEEFNKATLRCFIYSPKWEPAIEHNRKVSSFIKQSVNYNQSYF